MDALPLTFCARPGRASRQVGSHLVGKGRDQPEGPANRTCRKQEIRPSWPKTVTNIRVKS